MSEEGAGTPFTDPLDAARDIRTYRPSGYCASCKFFSAAVTKRGDAYIKLPFGDCRRFPPSPQLLFEDRTRYLDDAKRGRRQVFVAESVWPQVEVLDSCGEFRERASEPRPERSQADGGPTGASACERKDRLLCRVLEWVDWAHVPPRLAKAIEQEIREEIAKR